MKVHIDIAHYGLSYVWIFMKQRMDILANYGDASKIIYTLYTHNATKFLTAQFDATCHMIKWRLVIGSRMDWAAMDSKAMNCSSQLLPNPLTPFCVT